MSGRAGHPSQPAPFLFESRQPAEEKARFFSELRAFAQTQGWSRAVTNEIELILEEWLANILAYGLPSIPAPFLKIEIFPSTDSAHIGITDNGIPFDPTRHAPPDLSLPAEKRPIGGLGIFMMRKLSTTLQHERRNGYNILTIEKNLTSPVLTKG